MDRDDLVRAACEVRQRSYSPYSRFRVGAALLGASGRVYAATNVENASFGLSICAERAAVCAAVAAGETALRAIAICADGERPTPPCGACRQVLREFGAGIEVFTAGERGPAGEVHCFRLEDLLPAAFVDFPIASAGKPAGETA